MRVKFVQGWKRFERGQVVEEMHNGQAEELVRRGIAVEVKEQAQKPSKGKK